MLPDGMSVMCLKTTPYDTGRVLTVSIKALIFQNGRKTITYLAHIICDQAWFFLFFVFLGGEGGGGGGEEGKRQRGENTPSLPSSEYREGGYDRRLI